MGVTTATLKFDSSSFCWNRPVLSLCGVVCGCKNRILTPVCVPRAKERNAQDQDQGQAWCRNQPTTRGAKGLGFDFDRNRQRSSNLDRELLQGLLVQFQSNLLLLLLRERERQRAKEGIGAMLSQNRACMCRDGIQRETTAEQAAPSKGTVPSSCEAWIS